MLRVDEWFIRFERFDMSRKKKQKAVKGPKREVTLVEILNFSNALEDFYLSSVTKLLCAA